MSKKAVPDGFMDNFMSGKSPTDAPQKTDKRPTKAPRKAHKITTETRRKPGINTTKAPLKKYHIRLSEKDWKALQTHFNAKGLKVSQGIRLIVSEYMEKKGL